MPGRFPVSGKASLFRQIPRPQYRGKLSPNRKSDAVFVGLLIIQAIEGLSKLRCGQRKFLEIPPVSVNLIL